MDRYVAWLITTVLYVRLICDRRDERKGKEMKGKEKGKERYVTCHGIDGME